MRTRAITCLLLALPALASADETAPKPRVPLKGRLQVDPDRARALRELEKVQRIEPPAPAVTSESTFVEGVLHAVLDGALLIAVEVKPEELADMPWIRVVSRADQIEPGTALGTVMYLSYPVAPDAASVEWLERQQGLRVRVDLTRIGEDRAFATRIVTR
jgi:hypothetical protein